MRNAILPPASSHTYDFGTNEVHMPNWDVSLHAHSKIGFCMDSKLLFDVDNDNQLRVEGYSFPIQPSIVTHQPGDLPTSTLHRDDNISHQSLLLGKKVLAPQIETAVQNGRKRALEANDVLLKNGISELTSTNEGSTSTFGEWRNIKRNKTTNYEHQYYWNHHDQQQALSTAIQHPKLRVQTVRRSQKLSDKITALQKLVSPYGKTDTASVLQEASVYIKLLQDQIQNLLRMLCSSYDSIRDLHSQENGERRLDLRSKGLCLVPVSYTQQVTMDHQDPVDHRPAMSRKSVLDRKFYFLQ